jgi:hypothetical protein
MCEALNLYKKKHSSRVNHHVGWWCMGIFMQCACMPFCCNKLFNMLENTLGRNFHNTIGFMFFFWMELRGHDIPKSSVKEFFSKAKSQSHSQIQVECEGITKHMYDC